MDSEDIRYGPVSQPAKKTEIAVAAAVPAGPMDLDMLRKMTTRKPLPSTDHRVYAAIEGKTEDEEGEEEEEAAEETEDLAWRPSYLKRRILVSFCILFVILAVALQVLLEISNKNQGLTSSNNNLRYLWTFGPTALVALIAAFWARVEYQTKVITPWINLSHGPTSAKDTIMLDYVSVWAPKAAGVAILS
jgi:hypothetical protein